jgi:ATP-dependent Clp protease ATP-binding subunit ClpA
LLGKVQRSVTTRRTNASCAVPCQSAPTGHIPFTPRAKKVLELSLREALQLGHNYMGTEHILLGLIREGEGVAAQVLVTLGADRDRVCQQVVQLLGGYAGGVEARARTRLVHMTVPTDIREDEEQLAQVRREEAAIDDDDFERAAALRDQERQLLRRLAERERHGQPRWTSRRSSTRTRTCTTRSSACGSCLFGTGSTQTVGPRRPP